MLVGRWSLSMLGGATGSGDTRDEKGGDMFDVD
jgi:hypothetical protein